MNYTEAKSQQLTAAGTYRVHGHALEFDQDARKGWRPVIPCRCVQDSPQNPCFCNKSVLWWLWEDAIIDKGDSGRKDDRGKELQYFDVLADSTILVESTRPVRVGALRGLGTKLNLDKLRDRILGGEFAPAVAPGAASRSVIGEIIWEIVKEAIVEALADLLVEGIEAVFEPLPIDDILQGKFPK